MAREKGNLSACLRKMIHHVAPHKVELMMRVGASVDAFKYRFDLVRGEAETVLKQLERITEIAEKKGYKEILDIVNEEVEFGHDFNT